MVKFRGTIELNGKTATGIQVPDRVVAGLGSKHPKVSATINGYTYRTSVASMGGRFLLGVNADVRAKAGVAAGDRVEVTLELDTAPREVTVPRDFQKALAGDAKAKKFFESFSYSQKQRYVLAIEGAKTPETRQRRIDKSVANLHDGIR